MERSGTHGFPKPDLELGTTSTIPKDISRPFVQHRGPRLKKRVRRVQRICFNFANCLLTTWLIFNHQHTCHFRPILCWR